MTHSPDASDRSPVNQFFQSADDDLVPPPTASLQTGLVALKQGHYKKAIAHLEAVCQSALDEATHLKAQMGLIKAYEKTGDLKLAIALCKPLCQHSSERIKQWSQQALSQLELRAAQPPPPAEVVPVPEPPPASPAPTPQVPDATGFMPLTAPASATQRQRVEWPAGGGTQIQSTSTQIQPSQISEVEPAPSSSPSPQTPPFPTEPGASDEIAAHPAELELPPESDRPPEEHGFAWRNGGRAQKWNALLPDKGQWVETWMIQGLTTIALVLVLRGLLQGIVIIAHSLRNLVTTLLYQQRYGFPSTGFLWWVVPIVLLLWAIAPWLMTGILRWNYGARSLSNEQLEQSSPESLRLVKRLCNRERCPRPHMLWLPATAPITLAYGHLPYTHHLVISQGALDQFADEELASLVASNMAHILQRTNPLMTLLAVIIQLPYLLYWKCAVWSDRLAIPVVNLPFVFLSFIGYGLYRLLRYPGLWLSRYRIQLSDRLAANETGNPNALSRALLKMSLGMAQDIQRQAHTPHGLESMDLLMPISYRSALSLSGASNLSTLESILTWEVQNPHRRWLSVNNTHPPLGDRLLFLSRCAQRWQLSPECSLPSPVAPTLRLSALLRQAAPFVGLPIGVMLAFALWGLGLVADWMRWDPLIWLWGDRPLMYGLGCIGCAIGLILRVNPMFPDITRQNSAINPPLPDLFTTAPPLPLTGHPVQLYGKLLGRPGWSNACEQDLLLQTESGLIKLHYLSPLGATGCPHRAIQNIVTITGWFRRGATPWIDVDRLQIQGRSSIKSGHPIWSTLAAFAIAFLGIWIIIRGIG